MPRMKAVGADTGNDVSGLLKDLTGKLQCDSDGAWRIKLREMLKSPRHPYGCGETGRKIHMKGLRNPLYRNHLARWEEHWKRDLSNLWIPEHREGFDRLLVIPQGLRANEAYDRLGALRIKTWKCSDNLDAIFSSRMPNRDYAVWVRDRQEADEEWQNKSANDLLALMVNGITLTERLVFAEDWFIEKKTHLDEQNVTLCSGSRLSAGSVPEVRVRDGVVRVSWCSAASARDILRVREAVS